MKGNRFQPARGPASLRLEPIDATYVRAAKEWREDLAAGRIPPDAKPPKHPREYAAEAESAKSAA